MSERALSERVDAPTELFRPAATDGISWRAATLGDVPGIHQLELEAGAIDHPHYTIPIEDLEFDFGASYVNLAEDTILAIDPAGAILGWGIVIMPPGQETLVRSMTYGAVRPSLRGTGLGRQLFAWQVSRGEQQLASSEKTLPGWLTAWAPAGLTAAHHLYERNGLEIARYFLELRRDLAQPIDLLPLDSELRVESFTAPWHDRTMTARNESFRDHWGSQPATRELWDSFVQRDTTRADLSSLAIGERDAEVEVAGFVLVTTNEEDWPGQGFSSAYIDLVGVTRPWRGRGVAASLIANTMRLAKAAGLEKAVLDVDAENPTGALGLYTGLGFAESNRSLAFTRVY